MAELPQHPGQPREFVGETLHPRQPLAPPTGTVASAQTGVAELRARLKTLTTLTAIGGALLLAAMGGLLIWG